MAATHLREAVRQMRRILARQYTEGLTDAGLWARYVHEQDDAAFEALVRRHGPMVMGVCRRILRNTQDAEDAFQATFLVLVRKAASLRSPSTIANWLHGVARRTALEARSLAARRRAREATVLPRTALPPDPCAELLPVLDQELGRLDEKFRVAVILCDLEGKTRKQVAQQLGWPEGTVASRLARGRSVLAKRLACRGFGGALAAVALADAAVPASVQGGLVVSTATAACLAVASDVPGNSLFSANVIALTEGVLKSMILTKLKNAVAVMLVLGIAALGTGGLIFRTVAAEQAEVMPGFQKQVQAKPDDLHDRVVELKRQLQQMQKKIAKLEEETQPRLQEGKSGNASLAKLFKYKVPFETGVTESKEGGRIEIREVWGTRPLIEVGGQYLVRGKYVLPPGEHAKLYFYATATGAWGQATTATLDLQAVALDKQEGEFTLVHGLGGPGYFHLYLAAEDRYSRMFANVYFGTGDNVLRQKSW
jgi:RNA polymerase sigma factor (sigma-70 family)